MARLDSYGKRSVKNILNEHNRSAKEYKNYVDKNRSKLNWNYGAGDRSSAEVLSIFEERCKTIMNGRKLQENTNIMSDWIFTYPQEMCVKKYYDTGKIHSKTGEPVLREYYSPANPEHCKKWMDEVYAFCEERYGKENVIAGYVHMDETTPHMDVNLVPEAVSRKTGRRTVSSASLFTKSELRNCQRDLEKHMQKVFGVKGMILNGRTKGNLTREEMKERQEYAEQLAEREDMVSFREANQDAYEEYMQDKLEKQLEERYEARERALNEKAENIALEQKKLLRAKLEVLEREKVQQVKEADFQVKEDALEAQKAVLDEREAKLSEREAREDMREQVNSTLIENGKKYARLRAEKNGPSYNDEPERTGRGLPDIDYR